ncbi:GGDEF domain-containing protein [Acidiphilium sp.]|uniref:GGDEF domain-containing protein n=1 Tax=Acidiphilium sp. TaxID=527 RepID=UPI003D08A114
MPRVLGSGMAQGRTDALARLLDSLIGLPDAATAMSAACALVAAELTDAGVVLAYRPAGGVSKPEIVLADYPAGIGLTDTSGAEILTIAVPRTEPAVAKAAQIFLIAWRSCGDRRFNAEDEQLLRDIATKFTPFADRLTPDACEVRPSALDPETGLWSLPSFVEQVERRFDRLDIEDRIGTMFAFGWVRSDGSAAPEASAVVVRGSVGCLQEMLRPVDLIGRVGPTRLAAWCDGVDHLIAAERGDRIVTRLDSLLNGSGRHAAIGIASRWPRSGDDPATLLSRARAGLEQARLKAATQARPAVRIWQPGE